MCTCIPISTFTIQKSVYFIGAYVFY
jgi:hypothetical protein